MHSDSIDLGPVHGRDPAPKPIPGFALVAVPPGGLSAPDVRADCEQGTLFAESLRFAGMFRCFRLIHWWHGVVTADAFNKIGGHDFVQPHGEALAAWAGYVALTLAGLDSFGAPFVYLGSDDYLPTLRKTGNKIIAPFEGMDPVGQILWLRWAALQPHNPFLQLLLRNDLR